MGLHEIKKLMHTKRNVSKLKRPPTEWEKIFTSYIRQGTDNQKGAQKN
jgi:hypothetical protein